MTSGFLDLFQDIIPLSFLVDRLQYWGIHGAQRISETWVILYPTTARTGIVVDIDASSSNKYKNHAWFCGPKESGQINSFFQCIEGGI